MQSSNRPQLDAVRSFKVGPKVTILEAPPQPSAKKPIQGKGKLLKKLAIVFVLVCCIGLGVVVAIFTSKAAPIFSDKTKSLAGQVGGLFSLGQTKLSGETDGQINVLLLGIGGENHDGGYLSDSIMLAQIRPKDQQIVITSIPRDLVLDYPGLRGRKVNVAFAEGYFKNKDFGEALELARKAIGELTGKQIAYSAVVDFQGFSKLIDAIGGVDIEIDQTFTDYKYPDGKYGYLKPVTFEKGTEHMTGSRALIYARSRHAPGSEGSDFARSKRQHQVITSAKKKVLSVAVLTSPTSLNKILDTVSQHIHTNFTPQEMWRMYSLTKNFTTISASLTPESGVICSSIQATTGAYILDACPGRTRADITAFFDNAFAYAGVSKEKPRVLLASTNAFGPTAKKLVNKLTSAGAVVTQLNFDTIKPQENIHYQINKTPATNNYFKEALYSKEVALPPPGLKLDNTKYDIVLVLKDPTNEDARLISAQQKQAKEETDQPIPAEVINPQDEISKPTPTEPLETPQETTTP